MIAQAWLAAQPWQTGCEQYLHRVEWATQPAGLQHSTQPKDAAPHFTLMTPQGTVVWHFHDEIIMASNCL